jgi:starch synthase (maltosyl-transferring)
MKLPEDGRRRVVIEGVKPEIDCGRFPAKRTVGDRVAVEADIFADGHDALTAVLLYRREDEPQWIESPMHLLGNDRWRGEFTVADLGRYRYTLKAWIDRFTTWRDGLVKKLAAFQDVTVDLLIGAALVEEASARAAGIDRKRLEGYTRALRAHNEEATECALAEELSTLMTSYPDRRLATSYERELVVVVDRERARFSTWYELFPRSCSDTPGRHGTFRDCERRLPYVASMGFDVLYLPPIHPIGRTHRKGINNAMAAGPDDPGSVWAIGSEEGGHTDIHRELGTLADFKAFVAAAAEHGLEVALDLAFQCTPDHPWVKAHGDWFRRRPDGSIQYAENPPKKYQDIYPLDFETSRWAELWEGLVDVARFWIDQGIRIFRVDNPHTKPFAFWEHLIAGVKRTHPDVIFLAEAFTRPKVMYRLAKLGFTQSYTYFTWRNTKWELTEYLTELTQGEVREYFRPNFWPNTPDILNDYLQFGGRPAFMARLVLAATLGANYGIYGPAFELCEREPFAPGSEEYLHSEKYEIKRWDLDRPDSLRDLIARVNRIRRENPALQSDGGLRFHHIDNDQLIAYSKANAEGTNVLLIVVNLDPHRAQSGWLDFPLQDFGLDPREPYQVHDLLTDARYLWHGSRNYVALDPGAAPAHVFRLRRRSHSERDFDYFM